MINDSSSMRLSRSNKLIYIADDDPVQSKVLSKQIDHFGYQTATFTAIDELRTSLAYKLPAVMLMDIMFPEGELAGITAIEELRKSIPDLPPVFFVSGNSNVAARVRAARAGSEAFFTKPINIAQIIDTLDRLTLGEDTEPYRVLIIDDSNMQARTNARILEHAGMKVSIINDPMIMEGSLDDSNPELILLDMYMERCTGVELAKAIRQMDSFLSVPIVFLSSETDPNKQIEAVGLGGDDFLVKPIKPEHLISSAKTRVDRYRKLRKLMYHDSLTGLINHGTLKDRIQKEINSASRQSNLAFTFAMIDLDHFKKVNDTYGHPVGDRVIKSLSQMLVRRLRSTDIIGRYGGEEFGIIMPGTDAQTAFTVLDELRQHFSGIVHQTPQADFSVTLSCGVASYPTYPSAAALCSAADQALYTAKSKGRNCVIVNEAV